MFKPWSTAVAEDRKHPQGSRNLFADPPKIQVLRNNTDVRIG